MNLELKKATDQICKDRGLDRNMLIETLQEAVRTSVLRRYSEDIDVEVTYNEETGDIEVYQFKIVVPDDDVANEDTQIAISDARKHDPSVQLDDEVGFRVNIEDLGRIAAQSAKQVIIQRMRDAEQAQIFDEFKDRIGEIVSGTVQRRDKGGWVISLGRTEAILPREEQIAKEHYKRGDQIQAIIIDVRKDVRGPQVVVSRSHRDYLAALFRREVPEVDEGVIQILGVARDPGSRAKVAVVSRDRDVDPVGACVGVRGSRIQNIVQELHGERIDIVVWSPDIKTYAKNAMAPAVVSSIVVNEAENLLEVIVPDDQLTPAIGRKGQNVKLAARLLGWKIDIYSETRHKLDADKKLGHGLEQVASVAEVSVEDLLKAGFNTLDKLRAATDGELGEKLSLTGTRIAQLRAAINFLAPVVEKQPESSSVEFMNRPAADAAENAGQEEEDEPEPEEYGTDDPSAGTVDGTDDQDLLKAGFNTLDKLRAATDGELGEKLSLTGTRIAQLRAAINFLAPVVEKQPESSSVEFMNRPAADAAENAGQEEEDEPEPEEYGTDDPSAGTVDGTDDQDPSEAGFTDPDGEAKDGADDENGPEDAR